MTVVPPFDAVSQDLTSDDIEGATIRSIDESLAARNKPRAVPALPARRILAPGRESKLGNLLQCQRERRGENLVLYSVQINTRRAAFRQQ